MAKDKPTTAIAVFEAIEAAQAEVVAQNPEQVTADIQARIMASDTVADVLDEGTTQEIGGNDKVLGRIVEIRSFTPRRGDFVTLGNEKWYVVLDAYDVDTGEIFTPPLATGGSIVLTQLAKLATLDAFPLRVRFIEKPTSRGTNVLRMVPPELTDAFEVSAEDVVEVSP